MFPNLLIVVLAALVPIVVGFIYYNPKLMGKAWMHAANLTPDKLKNANMPLILGISLIVSFMLSLMLFSLVVHQTDVYSIFQGKEGMGTEGSEVMLAIGEIMRLGGNNFRTFGHGAFHGVLLGLFIVFPILCINNLFDKKPFKLTLIHTGYWIITIAVMGGILCQWG